MSYFKEIPLSGKFGKGKFTKVSNRHYEAVNKITWSLSTNNRVTGTVDGAHMYLHVYVWFLEHGEYCDQIVDHKDSKDVLNNTIENLRSATGSQNGANRILSDKNRSGCKNVSFYPGKRKWVVAVGEKKCGQFNTIDEAVTAAKKASLEKYGQHSESWTLREISTLI